MNANKNRENLVDILKDKDTIEKLQMDMAFEHLADRWLRSEIMSRHSFSNWLHDKERTIADHLFQALCTNMVNFDIINPASLIGRTDKGVIVLLKASTREAWEKILQTTEKKLKEFISKLIRERNVI